MFTLIQVVIEDGKFSHFMVGQVDEATAQGYMERGVNPLIVLKNGTDGFPVLVQYDDMRV